MEPNEKFKEGFTKIASGFKSDNVSPAEFKNGKYPAWAVKAMGYTAREMRAGGYSKRALKLAGFTEDEIKETDE
ncbi:hypothetical protein CJD36_006395 [Flavipsychrobacter stenotrophus]|uniref:Uncharacterized protein n=1 Tax=Flavipsychrobacter stenotrophus TaxID=2077091 RepID=A0A2S7SXI9_9BACT|nr:hypothetical protein [Flavipsychrobacter stenotrophus]PQJ11428.1 hypothetical protein CJD36_006395 [Flavipsychrobacter stenotrophus]